MPAEALLPLFAVVLLANAALVAAAIRALRRSRGEPDVTIYRSYQGQGGHLRGAASGPARQVQDRAGAGPAESPSLPPAAMAATTSAADQPATRIDARPTRASRGSTPSDAQPTRKPRVRPAPILSDHASANKRDGAGATDDAGAIPATVAPGRPRRAASPAPSTTPRPARRSPSAAGATGSVDGVGAVGAVGAEPATPAVNGAPAAKGRRRRFALPNLDDDPDKVNRSIESFLSGTDASVPSATSGGPAPSPDVLAPGAAGPATTVAMVAVAGLARVGSTGRIARPARDEAAGSADAAIALVERTLRTAARATDVVGVTGRGRFRIVLAATGELAARAYLRRIRAAVEPQLDAGDPRFALVVATVTVLDAPAESANGLLRRRLDAALREAEAALDASDRDDVDAVRPPRAVSD